MTKHTVLVVEDDPGASRLVGEILRPLDVNVEFVVDGVDALESLRSSTPDLVILDIALPRVDGWEVLNTLNQAQRGVPVIVITAHGQGMAAERALDGGAKRFFEKPFIPAELAAAVTELLPAKG
jgi:CheY-like chemotaxis protein